MSTAAERTSEASGFQQRVAELGQHHDLLGYRQMLWIQRQQDHRSRREYALGRHIKRMRPLAKMGMAT